MIRNTIKPTTSSTGFGSPDYGSGGYTPTPSPLSSSRGTHNRKYNKGSIKESISLGRIFERIIIISLAAAIFYVIHQSRIASNEAKDALQESQTEYNKLHNEVGLSRRDNLNLKDQKEKVEFEKRKLELSNDLMRKENQQTITDLQVNQDLAERTLQAQKYDDKAKLTLENREKAFMKNNELLKTKIAAESHRDTLERFGPGPYFVKIWITLRMHQQDDEYTLNDEHTVFTIKLHPVDKMPHSVHLFLEQVHHKLWDGIPFLLNADHILQTGGGDPAQYNKFKALNLDKVFFQEYNEEYPHKKWTVGFTGRPGGPYFYINKIDNTVVHGPHGQGQWNLPEEADPCFGEVIDGHRIIDHFNDMKTDKTTGVLTTPIYIKEAWVVDNEYMDKDWVQYHARNDQIDPKAIDKFPELEKGPIQ